MLCYECIKEGKDGFIRWCETTTGGSSHGLCPHHYRELLAQAGLKEEDDAAGDRARPMMHKQEWEMTKEEHRIYYRLTNPIGEATDFYGTCEGRADHQHECWIRWALGKGLSVPAKVLIQYPEIQPWIATVLDKRGGERC